MSDKYVQELFAGITFDSAWDTTHWKSVAIELPTFNIPMGNSKSVRVIELMYVLVQAVQLLGGTSYAVNCGPLNLDGKSTTVFPLAGSAYDQRVVRTGVASGSASFTFNIMGTQGPTGILIPGDKFYFNFLPITGTPVGVYRCIIGYRVKNVNLQEYNGLLAQFTPMN